MADEIDRQIRERAYALWEADGKPHGKDRLHWDQATRDVGGTVPEEPEDTAEVEAESAIEVIEEAQVETAAKRRRRK